MHRQRSRCVVLLHATTRVLTRSPPPTQSLMHGMMGVSILGHVAKLHKWDDSAVFFDGTSLGVSYVYERNTL